MNNPHVTSDAIYLGIDVGTGSARAALFDRTGSKRAAASCDMQIWRPQSDFVEQSSDDIWRACCAATRTALADGGIAPEQVRGIGIDATCSLVVLDAGDQPVSVSPTGRNAQNVIVWMDHRALAEAEAINRTGHDVLRYVGVTISPEMQTPKLLWLKRNLARTWQRAARFLDLPDFLTYRATGDDTRSLCTTVCKWTYLGHESAAAGAPPGRWDSTYFEQIGLGDLAAEGFRRIGICIRAMGEPVGNGLTPAAAGELGLRPGTPVAVGIIDAHAGGLGVLGAAVGGAAPSPKTLETRLALIGGTSSCHMVAARAAHFVPGVWGPYYSAMIPGMWLTEGGQSATGALIDHVIQTHPRYAELAADARASGTVVYDLLNARLDALCHDKPFPADMTCDVHVLPYFHGNRSPRADATLRGMIVGLRLADTIDDLARLYLATIQAIAYGTRHIILTMNAAGHRVNTIMACGGGTKNPVFLREHADITGCPVLLPREPEAVLLGAALLGAVASRDFPDVVGAMAALDHAGAVIAPAGGPIADYHARKYRVFERMYADFIAYRALMAPDGA